MGDDNNEDSWLYGSLNRDQGTLERNKSEEEILKEELCPDADAEPDNTEKIEQKDESLDADTQFEPPPPTSTEVDDIIGSIDGNIAHTKESKEDPAHEMEEHEQIEAAVSEELAMNASGVSEHDEELEPNEKINDEQDKRKGEVNSEDGNDDDDDESDDDINVVIGDIKSGPSYNIKQRGNLLTNSNAAPQEKPKPTQGKFSVEEFESIGTINGVPAMEYSIDSLDEKPWRKPGADITDYFNYGFNEDTWRAYCERQKRFRLNESGVGLQNLTVQTIVHQPSQVHNMVDLNQQNNRTLTPLLSNESKHMMPRRMGANGTPHPAKENVIQVMTAECREYSRTGGIVGQNNFIPEDPFFDQDPFDGYDYEPTQDSQWANENPDWMPTGIKELTPGPGHNVAPPGTIRVPMQPSMMGPPMRHPMGPPPHPMSMGPPMAVMGGGMVHNMRHMGPHRMMNIPPPPHIMPEMDWDVDEHEHMQYRRERDRERDRERERGRDRDRERERERDRDRDRDRERDWERASERERDRQRERTRNDEESERPEEERERKRRDRDRDHERDRDRDRERPLRRERSRSREKSRRRSKSRDKERDRERKTREKKKHRKEKEESE